MISVDSFISYARGDKFDEKDFYLNLNKLVSVVINRYFRYYQDREELEAIANLEVIKLLKDEAFDESNKVLNYLFTGIRNRLTNFLYNLNTKFPLIVEDEATLDVSDETFDFHDVALPSDEYNDSWIDKKFGKNIDHYKGIYLFRFFQRNG